METLSLNSMKEYEQMLKYSYDDFAILDNIRFLPEIKPILQRHNPNIDSCGIIVFVFVD